MIEKTCWISLTWFSTQEHVIFLIAVSECRWSFVLLFVCIACMELNYSIKLRCQWILMPNAKHYAMQTVYPADTSLWLGISIYAVLSQLNLYFYLMGVSPKYFTSMTTWWESFLVSKFLPYCHHCQDFIVIFFSVHVCC